MNQPLYSIAAEIQQILAADEWTDEQLEALDSLTLALETKAENIASLINRQQAKAAELKTEIERLNAWLKSLDSKSDWLKGYLLRSMQASGRSEIETAHHRMKIQRNPPSVIETVSGMTPERYLVTIPATTRPDKKAIAEAIKQGELVEGWELRQTERLVLK